ncbi:putative Zn-binding protein involved in type VI secretion [Tibeticola sediminis]|uniref:Putative Zn-binding protein involved in type VI secretion n=1 Tax=Tibeticola sediminis TaxID=1917811 RepID=A0A3N4UUX9_9BURK|nr:PAAR domain-containing protein [Tibeticola sediminis]RPE72535.1 putative Zn-binding protein involved in type VI secretion [Tibeticola sediminis]
MGTGVVRLGDHCSGHGCFPSRQNAAASPNVLVNGRGWHRLGDGWSAHGCARCPAHGGSAATGSDTVYVNGRPACRIGDAVSCGSTMVEGSGDVICG